MRSNDEKLLEIAKQAWAAADQKKNRDEMERLDGVIANLEGVIKNKANPAPKEPVSAETSRAIEFRDKVEAALDAYDKAKPKSRAVGGHVLPEIFQSKEKENPNDKETADKIRTALNNRQTAGEAVDLEKTLRTLIDDRGKGSDPDKSLLLAKLQKEGVTSTSANDVSMRVIPDRSSGN